MHPILQRGSVLLRQLLLFGWLEAQSCAFAVAPLAGMVSIRLLPVTSIAPYDLGQQVPPERGRRSCRSRLSGLPRRPHWIPDLCWVLALTLFRVSAGSTVHFTVGRTRHRMPLALVFALIGLFLWLAENIATGLGAWRYPYQRPAWHPVSVGVWSSWALLVPVTFVLAHRLVGGRREVGATR